MSVINTNITSLIAQQNLNASKSDLTTAMERLSSGLRINSSADDAAGQAIANRMSAQITGLSQAQRNANDGISVAQTTEGALNQVNDNLQRIRELTVQAQNGTNSSDDLQSIQDEITARLDEIDRISEETSFNGVKVLSEDQTITIQVGANDGETIDIALSEISAETLGLDTFNVNGPAGAATAYADGDIQDSLGYDIAAASVTVTDSAAGGATNTLIKDDNGDFYVASDDGVNPVEYYAVDESDFAIVDSADAGVTSGTLTVTFDSTEGGQEGLRTVDPLASLDTALSNVDGLRSDLGALQNRFDSAITNLATTEINLTAARSRIQDADYATEVSNMTRNQILQQAGTSILAQANQLPQSVLSLLG